jgi:hypothetical protein
LICRRKRPFNLLIIYIIKNRSRPNQSIGQAKARQNETNNLQKDQQDINRHAGKITLTQDPLELQKALRDEWTRISS